MSSNSLNERVLKSCHEIYTKPDYGLASLAKNIDKSIELLVPRKKISILLMGNHSAGKSSFINWYLDEHVQKTGVAIETQGFTVVTSGKKRETLTGNATLHLYPHFKQLIAGVPELADHLTTEISTSKAKKFPLVNLIDSPGLVDGEMKYPFDINKSIEWWAGVVDLIFVFFDPIGQALCKRTLDICEQMAENGHREKMKFYLSKADEAGHEADRQRVMMQVVQELCKRPALNTHSFDMPTIFVPTLNSNRSKCINMIDSLCKDVETTIGLTIQNTLNALEVDCDRLIESSQSAIDDDAKRRAENFTSAMKKFTFYSIAMMPVIFFMVSFSLAILPKTSLAPILGGKLYQNLLDNFTNSQYVASMSLQEYGYVVFASLLCFVLAKFFTNTNRPVLSKKQKRELTIQADFIKSKVKNQKANLYEEYLQQSISTNDL